MRKCLFKAEQYASSITDQISLSYFYHVMDRGTAHRRIFNSNEDYHNFLDSFKGNEASIMSLRSLADRFSLFQFSRITYFRRQAHSH